MVGIEYQVCYEQMNPLLFGIVKQKRSSPTKSIPLVYYYVLNGNIYQAPSVASLLANRLVRNGIIIA